MVKNSSTAARRPWDGGERRSGRDRRQAEQGPPNGIERRKGIEPRQPEVREIELSASEWAQLEANVLPAQPASPAHKKQEGE